MRMALRCCTFSGGKLKLESGLLKEAILSAWKVTNLAGGAANVSIPKESW